MDCAIAMLGIAFQVLHPTDPRGVAQTDPHRLMWKIRQEFATLSEQLDDAEASGAAFRLPMDQSLQPALLTVLMDLTFTEQERDPVGIPEEDIPSIFCLLNASIWEMCHWPVE
jgi:hypothetical protein